MDARRLTWRLVGLLCSYLLSQLPIAALDTSPPGAELAWYRVTLCSSIGPVDVDLPGPVDLDGPRDLRNLAPPTVGTFAGALSADEELRFDALVIDRAGQYGGTDAAVLDHVVRNVDGNPELVELPRVDTVGGHAEASYTEEFNDRYLFAYAWARSGVVVVVNVGVHGDASAAVAKEANVLLLRIRDSVSIPALDGGVPGPCPGPSQRPL